MIKKRCKICGKIFNTYLYKVKAKRGIFCSKKCFYTSMKGKKPWNTGKKCPSLSLSKMKENNPMWKGGVDKKESDKRYSHTYKGRISHNKARKKWLDKNPEWLSKYQKRRLIDDVHYKIKRNINNAVWCKLNRYRGIKKDGRISDCLPYNIDELKIHLENQFTEGMSWDNYGKWHIDHIIPDSSFKYTSMEDIEFQKSWSLDNLRPLWAKENLIKGKRLLAIDK